MGALLPPSSRRSGTGVALEAGAIPQIERERPSDPIICQEESTLNYRSYAH